MNYFENNPFWKTYNKLAQVKWRSTIELDFIADLLKQYYSQPKNQRDRKYLMRVIDRGCDKYQILLNIEYLLGNIEVL